jgi:hypothetical protein
MKGKEDIAGCRPQAKWHSRDAKGGARDGWERGTHQGSRQKEVHTHKRERTEGGGVHTGGTQPPPSLAGARSRAGAWRPEGRQLHVSPTHGSVYARVQQEQKGWHSLQEKARAQHEGGGCVVCTEVGLGGGGAREGARGKQEGGEGGATRTGLGYQGPGKAALGSARQG